MSIKVLPCRRIFGYFISDNGNDTRVKTSVSLRVVLIIFDLVSFFLKKYHVTATRFKPKKSILHKNKNEIVSPKSITKIQRLRAGYNHVHIPPGFPPDYFDNFPLLKPCWKTTRIM